MIRRQPPNRAATLSGRLLIVPLLCGTGLSIPLRAADTYDVDPVHTVLVFKVNHLGYTDFYGRFNDISGTITIDEQNPALSSVKLDVKADSVDTHSDRRDQHLRSPDFLNASQFPRISFKSTKVNKKGDTTYEVAGDLTLRGVTKPLTVTLTRHKTGEDPWGNYRTGFNGSFTIKRTEFGVSYMPEAISDEVHLTLGLEAVRSKGTTEKTEKK
jgi:polyisoprenoid-binding protein YceI